MKIEDEMTLIRKPRAMARFWSKVKENGDCWEWTAATKTEGGSGMFSVGKRMVGAHRVSFLLSGGVLGAEDAVHRSCRNNLCCNPDHLYSGPAWEAPARKRPVEGVVDRRAKKLAREDVLEIKVLLGNKVPHKTIAKQFEVAQSTISNIATRKTWAQAHLPPSRVRKKPAYKGYRAKITDPDVVEIRRRSFKGETGVSIAKRFGVSKSVVSNILKRKTWAHVKNPSPLDRGYSETIRAIDAKIASEV